MTERCRCGAGLIAELAHCVMCGAARRPQAVMVGAGRHTPAARMPVAHPSFAPQPAPLPRPLPQPLPWPPQAAPAARGSSAPWIAGAAAVVVLAVAAAVAVLSLGPMLTTTPSAAPSSAVAPSTGTATTVPATVPATGTGSTSTGSSTSSSDELDAQVATDRAAVEGLAGQWVPQLSSKAVGTVDDGVSYDADTILAHYRGLAASYTDAKLLDSGDWPVFKRAGYRVVVVARPFSTAAGANAWCVSQGIDADQCFAKKLSHSGGPAGTTVQR